jgi:outer membrane protein OmpA-like peptidoglycan-associated protein
MSDTGIFATTAEVSRKAGANASSTANVEAYINQFMAESESWINTVCKVNFSTKYATLDTATKEILKMVASSHSAMAVINFDHSGYTSRQEVETMLDVLNHQVEQGIKELKVPTHTKFIISP